MAWAHQTELAKCIWSVPQGDWKFLQMCSDVKPDQKW